MSDGSTEAAKDTEAMLAAPIATQTGFPRNVPPHLEDAEEWRHFIAALCAGVDPMEKLSLAQEQSAPLTGEAPSASFVVKRGRDRHEFGALHHAINFAIQASLPSALMQLAAAFTANREVLGAKIAPGTAHFVINLLAETGSALEDELVALEVQYLQQEAEAKSVPVPPGPGR